MSKFIHEAHVYELLSQSGILTPKYVVIDDIKDEDKYKDFFKDGESVVLKGIADNLWHKSDNGALKFINFSKDNFVKNYLQIKESLASHGYKKSSVLACSKVSFKKVDLPSEGFFSIKRDRAAGVIINFGLGGIHTEFLASNFNDSILTWSYKITTPEEACRQCLEHVVGKVWTGNIRQGEELISKDTLLKLLKSFWTLAEVVDKTGIDLLEVNPVVIGEDGGVYALDGVGISSKDDEEEDQLVDRKVDEKSLLSPEKIGIIGVSEKSSSFGSRILANILKSKIDNSNITVIKLNSESFLGIPCVSDISSLKESPVDALILSLPAAIKTKVILDLIEQGGGASVCYLVAGGIGDGADTDGLLEKIKWRLESARREGEWVPALVGPNSLGVVLSPLHFNSLFLAEERLPIEFKEDGNIGFVSQSGAFFVTRFSNEVDLPIKYGFCIGNQIDLKISDFVKVCATDLSIKVMGVYAEGFDELDLLNFAKISQNLKNEGRRVVLYKGGRSSEGAEAAAGHTGAMAGDFQIQYKVLEDAGVLVAESIQEFSTYLRILSHYPDIKSIKNVSIITNAGFESVVAADILGRDDFVENPGMLYKIGDSDKDALDLLVKKHRLNGLVSSANPMDLTPMASDSAYFDVIEYFCSTKTDLIIVGLIPLTETLVIEKSSALIYAKKYKEMSERYDKPIFIVIDSGKIYDDYRDAFIKAGLAVFSHMESALSSIRKL